MIGIRADGNSVIATGHIMRCMAIGDCLREMGEEVLFFLAGNEMQEFVENRGFKVEVLGTDWKDMESEVDVFLPLLEKYQIKKLLLDSYQVTSTYLSRLHEKVEITYIDDLQLLDYPVEKVICYSVYDEEEKEAYRQHYQGNRQLYLGLTYIPLRKEFAKGKYRNLTEQNKLVIRDILITTGGTDSYHMALGIVEFLEHHLIHNDKGNENEKIQYHVVVGKFHTDKDKLQEMAATMPQLHLYENVVDMTTLMNHCDVAISAGGTTIFELCACGVPTLSFMMADNQKGLLALDKIGLVHYLGDVRIEKQHVLERIADELQAYRMHPQNLLKMSTHQRSLVDTKGAVRIAKVILS